MATKTASVQATKTPAVTAPITIIKQKELLAFIGLKNKIAKLERDLKAREDNFKDLLGIGVKVEDGELTASLDYNERRNVSWRVKAVELADVVRGAGEGEKWADEVTNATEPTKYIRLIVK